MDVSIALVRSQEPARSLARHPLDCRQVAVRDDRAGFVVLDRSRGDPEETCELDLSEILLLSSLPDPRADALSLLSLHPPLL